MAEEKNPKTQADSPAGMMKNRAFQFVILLGVVSLFSDVTYEAARSINGPYLAILGASATAVGFIAGLGELIGYSLRLVSGYISDKTRQYWLITFIGYAVNLLAVPLMALADAGYCSDDNFTKTPAGNVELLISGYP